MVVWGITAFKVLPSLPPVIEPDEALILSAAVLVEFVEGLLAFWSFLTFTLRYPKNFSTILVFKSLVLTVLMSACLSNLEFFYMWLLCV